MNKPETVLNETPELLSMFVYLRAGGIEEVENISRADLGAKDIILFSGETPIASYPRLEVFLYSRSRVATATMA